MDTKGKSHSLTTWKAIMLLESLQGPTFFGHEQVRKSIVKASPSTDSWHDMEFVSVWLGKDNPHSDEFWSIDDVAHYSTLDRNHTGHNHFIDIRKGRGTYDDFDGYSYRRGSGCRDMREGLTEVLRWMDDDLNPQWLWHIANLLGASSLMPLEEAINFYLNDEYVHAPCHKWYDNCSPPTENYSYFQDKRGKKKFDSLEDELASRFPIADNIGKKGKGIPYSVFMPVDNLARYWYDYFLRTQRPAALGPVLHAVQDVIVPHHASGTNGSWHARWEATQKFHIEELINHDVDFEGTARSYIEGWNWEDPDPPESLKLSDKTRLPAKNWRIDHLVTWLAFHAYTEFSETYGDFKDYTERSDFQIDIPGLKDLTAKGLAMSTIVMMKALDEGQVNAFIGNRDTMELHKPDCQWVAKMNEENKVQPLTLNQALLGGYNGCRFCMEEYDTG